MNIERLREICTALPKVKEDIKWESDLCFTIGEKMFCVTGLSQGFSASFKVADEEFAELCAREGIEIAPYVGRYKWILVKKPQAFTEKQWQHYIRQSYDLVLEKLPKKTRTALGL